MNSTTEGVRSNKEREILSLLQERGTTWTSALELSRISLAYGRAIHSLRHRMGMRIENRIEVQPSGVKYGFFRIKPADPVTVTPVKTEALPVPGYLFGAPLRVEVYE